MTLNGEDRTYDCDVFNFTQPFFTFPLRVDGSCQRSPKVTVFHHDFSNDSSAQRRHARPAPPVPHPHRGSGLPAAAYKAAKGDGLGLIGVVIGGGLLPGSGGDLDQQMQSTHEWHVSDFRFLHTLSQGTVSTTYCAIVASSGLTRAMKKYYMARDELPSSMVEQEIAVHSTLSHPAINGFYGTLTDDDGQQVYLILEYPNGGDLYDFVYSTTSLGDGDDFVFSEAELRERVIKPLVSAVAYLHSQHILHCDINPENLWMCDPSGDFKLANFASATNLTRNRANRRWESV